MANPLIWLLNTVISVYSFLLLVYIIMQLLIYFNIINPYQPLVSNIHMGLARIMEPVLGRIRRFLPPAGGMDFSPLVLFILLNFIQYCLMYYSAR